MSLNINRQLFSHLRRQAKVFGHSNVTGFRITALVTGIATLWAAFQDFAPWMWLFSLLMYAIYGCFGVVVTFHRYLTHHSFKFRYDWMEYPFTLMGCFAGTGSPLGWVMMHHQHHRYSDTRLDPHSPYNGWWRMLSLDYGLKRGFVTVKKMLNDPWQRSLHLYYNFIVLAWLGLLSLIGGMEGLLFFGLIPMFITGVMSNVTNFLGHMWGYRNFETKDNSVNSPLAALISFGEGWHNNHHRYPGKSDYRVKWWEFDFSGFVINRIKKKSK